MKALRTRLYLQYEYPLGSSKQYRHLENFGMNMLCARVVIQGSQ
jgi:hypothetical protein